MKLVKEKRRDFAAGVMGLLKNGKLNKRKNLVES